MISPLWSSLLCLMFIVISYWRCRNILHPQFVFTISWIYLIPLGAILNPMPSPDLELLYASDENKLFYANILIHIFLVILFSITLLMAKKYKRFDSNSIYRLLSNNRSIAGYIAYAGVLLLLLQFLRQFSMSEWNLEAWIEYSLGPRFGRPWGGKLEGGAEFIFTFLGSVFPLAGILIAFGILFSKRSNLFVFIPAFILLLFMQVVGGSRTPVALSILSFTVLWWISTRNFTRYIVAGTMVTLLVVLISLMFTFRTEGFSSMNELNEADKIEYHQDDNYFRLSNAILVSEYGNSENWSAIKFISTSLLNPIPRFLWSNKPLLDQDFYGNWKWSHVTITYIGEFIAMFGTFLGMALAMCYGLLSFWFMQKCYEKFAYAGGLIVYIGIAFYIYMASRSIFNLGMYAGLLFCLLIIGYYIIKNFKIKIRRKKLKMLNPPQNT